MGALRRRRASGGRVGRHLSAPALHVGSGASRAPVVPARGAGLRASGPAAPVMELSGCSTACRMTWWDGLAGGSGTWPALDPVRRRLSGAVAGRVAADQRVRYPHRAPHLRQPRTGTLAAPAIRQHRTRRPMGSAPNGWVTASWTHLPMLSAPFADFTWRHARRMAASRGLPDDNETEVARVLDELLTCAATGPATDRASVRITARTRAARRRLPGDAQIIELPTHRTSTSLPAPRSSRSASSTPTPKGGHAPTSTPACRPGPPARAGSPRRQPPPYGAAL